MHTPRIALPLLLLASCLVAACDRIESRLTERAASRALAGDRVDLVDDDSLDVVLCGTGSPIASADRVGPCTAILAGGHFFLVDIGPGAWRALALLQLPRARLDAILLTHFHSDHIGEVGEATVQSWISGRTKPLDVYGPPGVEQLVQGFSLAYAFDKKYRVDHHGVEAMPPAGADLVGHTVELPSPDGTAVVFDADGLRVTAFRVDHAPIEPAYGYRFDFGGRSVVISGDTKPNANLVQHAKGADLLVHEALASAMILRVNEYAKAKGMNRWAKLTADVVDYHTTPVEAAQVAKDAQVKMLALTHLVPSPSNFILRRLFLAGVSDTWDGKVVLGADGMHFKLPPNSNAIDVENL